MAILYVATYRQLSAFLPTYRSKFPTTIFLLTTCIDRTCVASKLACNRRVCEPLVAKRIDRLADENRFRIKLADIVFTSDGQRANDLP